MYHLDRRRAESSLSSVDTLRIHAAPARQTRVTGSACHPTGSSAAPVRSPVPPRHPVVPGVLQSPSQARAWRRLMKPLHTAILAALATASHMAQVPAINPDGVAMTISSTGAIDRSNPFFKPLGNGRFCASCQQEGEAGPSRHAARSCAFCPAADAIRCSGRSTGPIHRPLRSPRWTSAGLPRACCSPAG